MWQQQEVVDKLVNLIQKLQSRRETGQLTARHGDGVSTEDGIVVFVNGRITEARIGRRAGSEALNKLSSWENCLCWFVPTVDSATRSQPHTSHDRASEIFTNVQENPPSSMPVHSSETQTNPLQEHSRAFLSPAPSVPEVPYHVSQFQSALSKIEQQGLSRTHRHLFLLINGRRSIPDLMRLMGKEQDDVYTLLQDLERADVIRVSRHEPPHE